MNPAYQIGDQVYHVNDQDQYPGTVTGITQRPGTFIYHVTFDLRETSHYELELSTEKTIF